MSTAVTDTIQAALDWLTNALNAYTEATVFGVQAYGRLCVEGLLCVAIVYLLTRKSYSPPKRSLTKKEIDELCDSWTPEPLSPPLLEERQHELLVLESAAGPHITVNGKDIMNFASANYLGLVGHEKLFESCKSAIEKYGVGTCSTRSFYGTFDVHLDCEARIAKFLGTPDSVLYSYGLSTNSSVIPVLCNEGDFIVVDEGVQWSIQNGLSLSGSTVVYFKHNDMSSLEGILEKITSENKKRKKTRRYIIVEAVYQNSGKIAPLDEIIRLKERYHFRVMLDESNSFGVLGHSGRGLTEYFSVPICKVDIITAAMGYALATEGGFCTASAEVSFEHQRISSAGYTSTASLQPYLASAAISAIDIIEKNPILLNKLKENISVLWAELEGLYGLEIVSDPHSPIVFLRLKHSSGSMQGDLKLLKDIVDKVLEEDSVLVVASKRSIVDTCPLPLGITLFVSSAHSLSDLSRASQALKRVAHLVLTKSS